MFKRPFSFQGRIRRTEYGLSLVIYLVFIAIINILIGYESDFLFYLILILCIPLPWFFIAQSTKRCHDRGNSGWYQTFPFYPLWLLFGKGDLGINEYGLNPKNTRVSDVRERTDIPNEPWLQGEVDQFKQTNFQGQQMAIKANAPVQEGQEIQLKDKTFVVTLVDETGVTLNEMTEDGTITGNTLPVPPEDYEKVFGVPAVQSGQISPENVTDQGQNIPDQATNTGQPVENIPERVQLPVNKNGEIEYDQITEPAVYAQALTEEFGEDAPAILDELIAEQLAALEKAKKGTDPIKKRREIKAITDELTKLSQIKNIINPAPAGQTASPAVAAPVSEIETVNQVASAPAEAGSARVLRPEEMGRFYIQTAHRLEQKGISPEEASLMAGLRAGLGLLTPEEKKKAEELWANGEEEILMESQSEVRLSSQILMTMAQMSQDKGWSQEELHLVIETSANPSKHSEEDKAKAEELYLRPNKKSEETPRLMENRAKQTQPRLSIQLRMAEELKKEGYTAEEAFLMALIPETPDPERDRKVEELLKRGPNKKSE